eukprot:CAMPEP_0184989998 /NCGR_PEP_ID=MMETSP1098-20130426/30610_1 /TAXON_ID=89044 /ORGANISM="Spumella elongata, Strain CCAP 955/1" /LENGTH=241 /DNA_ID=CAMNT_0027515115 /DNA_START=14 /DNA_END=739 /DNA_ORIENTATION=+
MAKVAVLDENAATDHMMAQSAGANLHANGRLITQWSVDEVCDWLSRGGYSDLIPFFRKHSVSGAVLPKLNDALLKEMGIDVIGRRVLLLSEVIKIQAIARTEWRTQVLWSSEQYREGPCNNMLPYGFPCAVESCTGRPNMYTLTNSKLNILRTEKNCNTPCTGCFGFSIDSDNIDVSDIVDVDVKASTAAYGEPTGFVSVVDKRGATYRLMLRSAECQKTCALITNIKEEAVLHQAAMRRE